MVPKLFGTHMLRVWGMNIFYFLVWAMNCVVEDTSFIGLTRANNNIQVEDVEFIDYYLIHLICPVARNIYNPKGSCYFFLFHLYSTHIFDKAIYTVFTVQAAPSCALFWQHADHLQGDKCLGRVLYLRGGIFYCGEETGWRHSGSITVSAKPLVLF